jgi:hypothetical protein
MTHRRAPWSTTTAFLPALALALLAGSIAHAADPAPTTTPATTTTNTPAVTTTTTPATTTTVTEPATATSTETSTEPAHDAKQATTLTATPQDLPTTRTPLPLLQERFVGVASRATRFDWRATTGMVGLVGSELIERNNFASVRLGVLGRKAVGDLVVEGALTWADSFPTTSSSLIALTPYRQAGRPARAELEMNVAYPLAEAVTTASPWFVPPAEVVVSAVGGARYLLYPQLFFAERPQSDLPVGLDTAASVVSPVLTDGDVLVLEEFAAPGMAIDRARVQVLVGVNTDVYFRPGVFVSPRALLAVPLLAPFSSTSLGWWWEMSAVVGYAW